MLVIPNLRHLLAALEIDRCNSVSDAARRIHLSQSAVTQALSKLESSLGSQLFSRMATGVITTDAGRLFLHRVNRGAEWLKAIEEMVGGSSASSKRQLRRLLTTAQLKALIAVVDTGSYTRAAALLHLTQPTVHRAVRELEALCRQEFFQRSPFGVIPTWQARQVARYASLFFAEIAQGIAEINELQGVMTGGLVIGALPLSRTQMVPHTITMLLKEFPEAKIRIIDGPYNEQLSALLQGQLDVIVGALRSQSPSPDIVQEFLFSDPLNIVVRPDHWLARRRKLTPRQLRELDWIAPRENTPARAAFSHFFQREGLEPPQHVIECSSLVAIRGLLLESDRVALLPAKQVEVDVKSGLLAVSPMLLAGTAREIGMTLRKGWQPTKIQERFLQLLRSYR